MNKEDISYLMSQLGKLGAQARNVKLSKERKRDIAVKASRARWDKNKENNITHN